MQYSIQIYETRDGRNPFDEWMEDLADVQGKQKIRTRLNRLALGLLGDCDPVGQGVHELKIDFGPGYRVYFGMISKNIVLILSVNSKKRQQKDIDRAKEYFEDYKKRKNYGIK